MISVVRIWEKISRAIMAQHCISVFVKGDMYNLPFSTRWHSKRDCRRNVLGAETAYVTPLTSCTVESEIHDFTFDHRTVVVALLLWVYLS